MLSSLNSHDSSGCKYDYYSHFIDEETKSKRKKVTCSRPCSQKEENSNPGSLLPKSPVLTHSRPTSGNTTSHATFASEFRYNRRHPIATCLSEHRGLRQSLSSAAPSGGGNWMHQSDEGMKKNHLSSHSHPEHGKKNHFSSPRHPERGKTAARGLCRGVTAASTAHGTQISSTCGPPASVAVTWWAAQRLACRACEKTQTLTRAAQPLIIFKENTATAGGVP